MSRGLVAPLILLPLCLPGLLAQTIKREGTITLPAGVSVTGSFSTDRPSVISRTGSRIAGQCSDRFVRVWNFPSGDLVRSLDTRSKPITGLQLSDDGRLLAISNEKGSIELWDVASGRVQAEPSASSAIYNPTISPDNHLLAGITDYDVPVWDLTTGKRMATLRTLFGHPMSLAFSPDSTLLATADQDTAIRVYDAHTGTLQSAATDGVLESLAIMFSADGKTILAGGTDRTISVIDPTSGKTLGSLPKQPGVLGSIVISDDGKQAVALYFLPGHFDRLATIMVWDLPTRTARATFDEPDAALSGLAFAHDRFLLTGSSGNQLVVWSIR
jgi:WD40 repeat protein